MKTSKASQVLRRGDEEVIFKPIGTRWVITATLLHSIETAAIYNALEDSGFKPKGVRMACGGKKKPKGGKGR